MALAVILWPLGPNQAAEVLKKLRYSNKVIDEIRATMELGTAIDAAFPKDDAAAKKIVPKPNKPSPRRINSNQNSPRLKP